MLLFSGTKRENNDIALSGFLWQLQDKMPYNLLMQQQEIIWSTVYREKKTTMNLQFTFHPWLVHESYSTWDHLFSGNIHVDTVRTEWAENDWLKISISWDMITMTEDKEVASFVVQASIVWVVGSWWIYLLLEDVFLEQTEKEIAQVWLRYMLIKKYIDRWVYFDKQQLSSIYTLSPNIVWETLQDNAQRTRILSDQAWGRIYTLSGENLIFSWYYNAMQDYAFSLWLPFYDLDGVIENTHISDTHTIFITQKNDYAGIFEWVMETEIDKKSTETTVRGDAIWPWGIWIWWVYTFINKPISWKSLSLSVPEKSLDRGELVKLRKYEE